MNKEVREWLISIVVALVLMVIVRQFLFTSYTVNGASMEPTFHDQNRVIVSKLSRTMDTIKEGDVIILHHDSKRDFIKRVIGLPGDKIEYKDDQLYVNGKQVEEKYLEENRKNADNGRLMDDFSLKTLPVTHTDRVPKNHVFVLGDNRENSFDGDEFGYIKKSQIVGKVVMRYYPFDELHTGFGTD